MRTYYNRIKFDGKPSESVRSALKRNGFFWDRGLGVWKAPQSVASAAVCDYFADPDADPDGLAEYVSVRLMESACDII